MKDFKTCLASRYCRMQTAVQVSALVLMLAVISIFILGDTLIT